MPTLCSIEDCPNEVNSRGWCKKHYNRWYKWGSPNIVNRPGSKRGDSEKLFWEKVDKTGDCWLWLGATDDKGYGYFNWNRRTISAHRISAHLLKGLDLANSKIVVDHQCRNPSCARAEHLLLTNTKRNSENVSSEGHKDNESKVRGVSWCSNMKKWRARVGHNYKENIAGYFDTIEEAGHAAKELRLKLFTNNIEDRK